MPIHQPNSGATSPESLFGICMQNAERRKIYTSFFGLGLDFGIEVSTSLLTSASTALIDPSSSWWM